MNNQNVILASGSPVRRRLLANAGLRFYVQKSHVKEVQKPGEDALVMGMRFAREKALSIEAPPDDLVIGVDQVGLSGTQVLRKCHSKAAAMRQLQSMSGREHRFHCFCAIAKNRAVIEEFSTKATIRFREISDAEISTYLSLNEWVGSAGSYQLEGYGARFVQNIEGNESTVLGLPLFPLLVRLRKLKIL